MGVDVKCPNVWYKTGVNQSCSYSVSSSFTFDPVHLGKMVKVKVKVKAKNNGTIVFLDPPNPTLDTKIKFLRPLLRK